MFDETKETNVAYGDRTSKPLTELPLLDNIAVRDWCEDLEDDDISEILARVPLEVEKCFHELQHAINTSDLGLAKRVAHRMKGMAANLGASRLAHIARNIECSSGNSSSASAQMPFLRQTVTETLAAFEELQ